MTERRCPLCLERADAVVGEVAIRDLIALYVETLGVDVRSEFAALSSTTTALVRCAACDLRFFAPSVVGTEALYGLLQRFDWYYRDAKPEYAVAARFVSASDDVLEFGCGKGAFAAHVAPGRYTGLELSRSAQRMAAAQGVNVLCESLQGYAARRPRSCDVVAGFQVLEHLSAPREALEAAVACLRPGGRLILSVPSEDGFTHAQTEALNFPPHHQTRWSDRALGSIATLLGLEVVALEHDVLADVHVELYCEATIDAALCRTLGWRRPPVDMRWGARWRRRAARSLARAAAPLVRLRAARPRGHDVTAVYRLPGQR